MPAYPASLPQSTVLDDFEGILVIASLHLDLGTCVLNGVQRNIDQIKHSNQTRPRDCGILEIRVFDVFASRCCDTSSALQTHLPTNTVHLAPGHMHRPVYASVFRQSPVQF